MAAMLSCQIVDWDAQKCQRLVRRAIELDPNSWTAWMYLFQYYIIFDPGSPDAKRTAEQLVKLNPIGLWAALMPAAWATNAYHNLREPELLDEALVELAYARQLDPNFWFTDMLECAVLGWKGRFDEALGACRRSNEHDGGSSEGDWLLAVTLVQGGHRNEALDILYRLKKEATTAYVPPMWFAMIYAVLGDREECIAALEQALRDGDWYLLMGIDEPALDFVLDDPRVEAIYRQLNLPRPKVPVRPAA